MLKGILKAPLILAIILIVSGGVFYFELVHKKKVSADALNSLRLIPFEASDVNYIVIERSEENLNRIVLQKSLQEWSLVEPVQDLADQVTLKNLTESLVSQTSKTLNIENQNLSEFGLDRPFATWTVKTSQGQSFKIRVGSETNFEGFPFIAKDGSPNVILGSLMWKSASVEPMTYFREKRLFREPIESLNQVRIKTLSNEFELLKQSDQWTVTGLSQMQLDQDKVKSFFQRFASMNVTEYLGEGEPSKKEIIDLGLDKNFVQLDFIFKDRNWTIRYQLKSGSSSLYGLTTRPTQLLRFEPTNWELLANLSIDQFRNRKAAFEFESTSAKKIYFKLDGKELEIRRQDSWELVKSNFPDHQIGKKISSDKIEKFLLMLSRHELDYFLDEKTAPKFAGQDMVIVHDANDQLLLQLNWGPKTKQKIFGIETEFFLARTQKENTTFGLSPDSVTSISNLNFMNEEAAK